MIRKSVDFLLVCGHGIWVWNHSTNTTGDSFVVNDCSLVIMVFSVHCFLIGCLLWVLELDVFGNVEWLSSQEILLKLFSVYH